MEPNNPTYAYELEQTVQDGWLVPPKAITVPIKISAGGIKFKRVIKQRSSIRRAIPRSCNGSISWWNWCRCFECMALITDTVDKVIAHLMKYGIKVEEEINTKTIIFVRSQTCQVPLKERFNVQYRNIVESFKGNWLSEEYRYDGLK